MNSGAARVSGAIYKDVTIAGKKIRLSRPKFVGIFAEIEAFILSRKEDPMVIAIQACKKAPPALHKIIMESAIEQANKVAIVTQEDLETFEQSAWGTAFTIWKALDPKHAEEFPDVESVMTLIEEEVQLNGQSSIKEIMIKVNIVTQWRDLKNSDGRSEIPAQSQATADLSATDGQHSTSTSSTDSGGTETP